MQQRSLIASTFLALSLVGGGAEAATSIPLTIQEALYPGSVSGVTRTADPVTVGIPLPDDPSTGATDISQLSLSGASAGQFRVLGRWPSGRIKWVLVDTLASVNAGGTATGISLTTGGTGNFGGPDLAVDSGGTISVSTGAASFAIRKANFNGFDQVVVGGTTVVASGTSGGLVVMGPPPGASTCSPGACTTPYHSIYDSSSTAVIEENGPVRAVIRATGSYVDASGNAYLKFTVRMHFYRGLARVKAVTTLRNADNGASNSLAVAYKGVGANEWRLVTTLAGTKTFNIAKQAGTVETGTLAGSDEVYLYQGESLLMKEADWCGGCVPYTTDSGYILRKNGSTLATGSNAASDAPGGWADIRDASGAGVSIGVYQMAAYWPKSLEFKSSGNDVRIGIWPSYNSRTFHQAWPQWSTHDLYFNFHGSALASPANEFLKFQHYLIARAPYTHYNTAQVFGPYSMVSPASEQAFYQSAGSAAIPTLSASNAWPYLDKGIVDSNWVLPIFRWKAWGAGGGGNQIEFRWSYLMNWITRGMTGRYLDSMHYYRFITDDVFPHSDGFNWRDQTGLDAQGFPARTSANSTLAFRDWIDISHPHWYGMGDYYFMTGDELAKEQLLDGVKDYYTVNGSGIYAITGQLATTRAVALHLLGAARYAAFLKSIGDTATATTVLDNTTSLYNKEVAGQLCPMSDQSYAGCTANLNPSVYHENTTPGTSRLRGIHWSYGLLQNMCGASVVDRMHGSFMSAMLVQGILEFRQQKGTSWGDYWNALDLAYGISQASLSETYKDTGSGRWDDSGFRAYDLVDLASSCPSGTDDSNYEVNARATEWMHFYAQYLVTGSTAGWTSRFKTTLQKLMGALSVYWQENGSYQVSQLIDIVNKPAAATLQPVAITNVTNSGNGSYTISWMVPAGTQSYRIKWGPKSIVDWIGFNPDTYTFIGNPASTMNWFAATNVPTLPAPAAAGTIQSLTINTGVTGLTTANFSVKAYVGSGSVGTSPPAATTLLMVSGNNQSANAGSRLPAPFTVKVTDSNGGAVSGVAVTFLVTAGGGTLSSTAVATDASGLASSTLTLGTTAGTNTVTASSGTLTGSPVTFTAVGLSNADANSFQITSNQWTNVTPTYQGAPNGGQLTPMTYNTMSVYDPSSKRTISFDRWYDTVRKMSIYANGLIAYDPPSNVATVVKLDNWTMTDTTTDPLPANTTDPTPIDRHPLGGLALDSAASTVYLVNGANQTGHAYYPDHPNDTWRLQLSTRTWTKVADGAVDVHPPNDTGNWSGMVYDPVAAKLVYFVSGGSGTVTWFFDPRLNKWSSLTMDSSAMNVHISTAGITYDAKRNAVVAYGGGDSSGSPPSTQLWSYSLAQNKWTALPSAPIAAASPEFAYDSIHDIFLGLVGQTTVVYNPRATTWTVLAATIARGQMLNRQNMAYNPAYDVFVFQGGTWDVPIWSLFRYTDAASPAISAPSSPTNLRIIK